MSEDEAESGDIPPTSDPRWEEWCKPLFGYLYPRPRTWADLRAWRKQQRVSATWLQNMLSWLSVNHMADWDGRFWRAVSEVERQLVLESQATMERILREEIPSSRPGPGQFFYDG